MSIEVEHKFTVTPLTRQQLEAMGAKRKTSCTFTDTYLDVKHNTLMLSDCWLRKRDGAWELKHPLVDSAAVGQSSKDVGHVSDRYNELQNEVEILAFLRTVIATEIDVCTDSGPTSLDQLVQEGILISVAEFETTRETYVCKSGDHCETFDSVVHVDLDETKFGYVVGEVEVMVGRGELIPAAEAKALDIAKQIGRQVQAVLHFQASFPGLISSHKDGKNSSLIPSYPADSLQCMRVLFFPSLTHAKKKQIGKGLLGNILICMCRTTVSVFGLFITKINT